MKQTIRMTVKEIHKNLDVKAAIAMAKNAPVQRDPYPQGKIGGRGFASFREHINRLGRPRNQTRKIMIGIRLPESVVMNLRATNGYSSMVADYVLDGINRGALDIPSLRRQAA
jgi:hypothetical protein